MALSFAKNEMMGQMSVWDEKVITMQLQTVHMLVALPFCW